MGRQVIDITGKKFTRLTAIKKVSVHPTRNCHVWEFICDCGNTVTACKIDVSVGKTKSCGCFGKDLIKERNYKHGNSVRGKKTKAYDSWAHMVQRCTNPNNKDYSNYGGKGLKIQEGWADDFSKFLAYVGDCPNENERWSLGRIDNDIGYVIGNVRWETDEQQARNRGMSSNNTTGHTGVHILRTRGWNYYVARADGRCGERKQKIFSWKIYGQEEALRLAIETRAAMILELNQQGAGYADNHGLPSNKGAAQWK